MGFAILIALLCIAGIYLLLEKHPVYGAWYGLARLTGARPDIERVDWATLRRHKTPNDALACPAGLCPNAKPDIETAAFRLEPAALLARLRTIAQTEPDTRELSCEGDRVARFIQRTRVMRFPDTIDVEVFPAGGGSTIAIYSRSLIGRRDFGVNRARVARWLAALEQA
jgi:uncharacterized protein (DUF1499 family)